MFNDGLTTPKVKLGLQYKQVVEELGMMAIVLALLYIIRSSMIGRRIYIFIKVIF